MLKKYFELNTITKSIIASIIYPTLQLQIGLSHCAQPSMQSAWHGQPLIFIYFIIFVGKLTVDTVIISSMTVSIALFI